MTDAVRFHGAIGGIIATLGTADSEARRFATGRIELVDGDALWPLVSPQLAPSVREELCDQVAPDASMRQSAIAWAGGAGPGPVVAAHPAEGHRGSRRLRRTTRNRAPPRRQPATSAHTAPRHRRRAGQSKTSSATKSSAWSRPCRASNAPCGRTRSTLMVYLPTRTPTRSRASARSLEQLRSPAHLAPAPAAPRRQRRARRDSCSAGRTEPGPSRRELGSQLTRITTSY